MNEFALPNGDLLIAQEHQTWVETALTKMMSDEFAQNFTQKVNMVEAEMASSDDEPDFWDPRMAWARPYKVKDGVLTVPVQGVLMGRFTYAFGGWLTGYDYVLRAVQRGVEDSNVVEIVLDVNSPGGYVPGCFECADGLYALRGEKPIRAFVDSVAASAAYAVASSADSINVVRTGLVGSIGVLAAHTEVSKSLENRGVTVSLIHAGDEKVHAHPAIPLSKKARKRMQARVDNSYGIFVATVARNRDLDEGAVRGTEAAVFLSHEAVENGLADAVGLIDSQSANADPSNENEDDEMSKNDTTAVDKAVHDTAVETARTEGHASGKTEGLTAGAATERDRINTILGSDEAKTRPSAARQVAMTTDMTAEAAATFLAGLPEEAKQETAPGTSTFENAMTSGDNPDLGLGTNESGDDEMSVSDSIFASAGHGPAS
ncbi:S49 family peptidase [Shimia sp.]|uniref:S49 family peptidase n=1 Tax=Shimia sp. TaxID=1954381 RepID=UPI003298642A